MRLIFIIFSLNFLFANELIFYCGITMSKPMSIIAKKFEKKYNIKIEIIPGGSKSLLKNIQTYKEGDLYLPGSESYVLKNKSLFFNYINIGYNKLAIIVKKNNPKNIHSLKDLYKKNVNVVLCNYKLSSCGKETKKILKNNFWKLYDKAIEIVLDSIPLNNMVKTYADAGLNWEATVKWKNYSKYLQAIEIKNAKKHKLLLAVVKYTKNKKAAEKFLNFVKKNESILKRYGFK